MSDRPDLKNVSVGPSNIESSHLRMENSILLTQTSATVNTEPFFTSQCSKSFGRTKKKTPVYEKTECTTFGMEIFSEKLSAKGISEEPSILIGSTRGSGTIFPSQTDLM